MGRKNSNNYIILTVLISVIFGLGAGISGVLISRSYLLNDIYSVPFYGKIDFSAGNHREGLIIENAKSIIIEQDKKVIETINSAAGSLVGIFEKIKPVIDKDNSGETFDIKNNYRLKDSLAEGLIITSDGWVLVPNPRKSMTLKTVIGNYVVIGQDNNIYKIDDYAIESGGNSVFLHLKDARDLPVKNFSSKDNLDAGQIAIALDWGGKNLLTYVVGQETRETLVKSSDQPEKGIVFTDDLSEFFEHSFVFDLNGNLIAIFNKEEGARIIDYFNPLIKNFLKKELISRASLGVNYIELSEFALLDNYGVKQGALISQDSQAVAVEPASSAEEAGLAEGDIIVSIDNLEIGEKSDLADILQRYGAGDEISLVYLRNGSEKRVKIILKELKQK